MWGGGERGKEDRLEEEGRGKKEEKRLEEREEKGGR